MSKKKILYLLWGEDVSHNNGIFLSQVFSQLATTQKLWDDCEIICVVGIPILKKRILLNFFSYMKTKRKLIRIFYEKNLILKFKNLLILSRYNSTKKFFPAYSLFYKKYIKNLI